MDKGAVVSLPYGVEGFTTPKHLVKEDGTLAKADEKLEFKVIEFNKDSKRIIVSHSLVFEDERRAEEASKKKAANKTAKQGMKKVVDNLEKTTLGDISELAALKEQMNEDAAEAMKKKAEKKAAKEAKASDVTKDAETTEE